VGDHGVLEEVRADGDHAPGARAGEVRQGGLDQVDGALDAAGELRGEGLVGDLGGPGTGVAVEGEVHQRVGDDGGHRGVEVRLRLGEEGVERGTVAHVGAHGEGPV